MAASSVALGSAGQRRSVAGLRPEPQGVRTVAAGAAPAAIAGPVVAYRDASVSSVFGRHSTQSSIAPTSDQNLEIIRALVVDEAVYGDAGVVYKSPAPNAQVTEHRPRASYTAPPSKELRRA